MLDYLKMASIAALLAIVASGAAAQETADAPEAGASTDTPTTTEAEAGAAAEGAEGAASEATQDDTLGLAMGQEGAEIGQTYIREEFGDWQLRCVRAADGRDPCQLYQLLQDDEGNNVAEMSIFPLPESGEAAAGATIITPLETLLTAQLALSVDGAAAKRYPFAWCSQVGCFARVGFTPAELESFRRGREATLTIRPVAAPDQTVDLGVSLSGFTAGFEAVEEANADVAQ